METESIIVESPTRDNERLSIGAEENEADSTIHSFNLSSINNTVIEKLETPPDSKNNSCEGSDSGVEVIEPTECTLQRAISTNSQDFEAVTSAQSCDSSIISCCSNYDEAYNLLVRRNSTLLDDYKLRNVDGTSENGSESSSVASTKISKRSLSVTAKKKVVLDNKRPQTSTPGSNRSRSKPPLTPRPTTAPSRGKSTELTVPKTPRSAPKPRTKPVPDNLALSNTKYNKETKPILARGTSTSRTPITTPTDDGRWPSIHSKPAPLMTRSLRGIFALDGPKPIIRVSTSATESKNTFDKYATLPRRRKERSADNISDLQTKSKPKSRENSVTRVNALKKQNSRESTPAKTLPPYPKKKPTAKIKIYHETSVQTALTITDIEKALAGVHFYPTNPQDVEKLSQEVQVDRRCEEIEALQERLDAMCEKYERLKGDFQEQKVQLRDTDERLKHEILEKDGLKEELKYNNERVSAMLRGNGNNLDDADSSDSLMVLEIRFQNVSQVIMKQEDEISKLNAYCRALQRDLDISIAAHKTFVQHQLELESESMEMQDFLQMEKSTLMDALKESEQEICKNKLIVVQKDKELELKQDECKHLVRISERRRQEYMGLEARFAALEAKCRELLVHQGSTVSGAAVALSALVARLDGLVEELVNSYNISEQELDDVIFHNEAYSNSSSSPDATPDDKCRKFIIDKAPSPKRGSSFVSAVINAIKNATAQTPFNRETSKDNVTDTSDSTELLDSETEPCLMMEHVLEDVVVPDTHTHNMISSGNGMITSARLTHSESLNNLSQAIINRQISENASLTDSYSSNLTSLAELCPSVSLVDQVIDVDNLVTRLLKVIRIIQMENDDYINELQDERDSYCDQTNTQKDTNKIVVTQLKDWENLGARLKAEVKELLHQLSKKNGEIEDVKNELNLQRKQVEKLNHDVCELSTALSKSELELKMKEEEVAESLKMCEASGEKTSTDMASSLNTAKSDVLALKEKLQEKEKQLYELTQEYVANRQVLTENLREAVTEAKKQYDALDNALETLHSIQSVVKQCPPLSQLQRDLEEISFQSASAMPLAVPADCNTNAALLKAMVNMEISSPTTA